MDSTPAIPAGSAEVTPGWVRQAFAAGGRADIPTVEDVDVEQVGVGIGHVGESLRCRLTYAGDAPAAPATVVVKLHSSHPETDKLARRVRLYRRECAFYQLLSHHAPIRSPILYYGDYERRSNRLVLVLEDLGGMGRVDEIEGANSEQAMSVVRAIARFHAYSWNKTGTAPYIDIFDSLDPKWRPPVQLIYLASLRRTFEVFGDHFSQHMQRITETLGWRAADYMGDLATGPRAFGHGDYRLDNMFFGPGPDDLAVIDWQVCGGNNPLGDVAYFLGGSLPVEVRRSIERGAIAEYHDNLRRGRRGDRPRGLLAALPPEHVRPDARHRHQRRGSRHLERAQRPPPGARPGPDAGGPRGSRSRRVPPGPPAAIRSVVGVLDGLPVRLRGVEAAAQILSTCAGSASGGADHRQ